MKWNLDTKVKVFHESISCFMKCSWNWYIMKCSERKFHSVSLPLAAIYLEARAAYSHREDFWKITILLKVLESQKQVLTL